MAVLSDSWDELYEANAFSQPNDRDPNDVAAYESMWNWIEKLRNEGKLRSIDVDRVRVLIETAYERGKIAGKDE